VEMRCAIDHLEQANVNIAMGEEEEDLRCDEADDNNYFESTEDEKPA